MDLKMHSLIDGVKIARVNFSVAKDDLLAAEENLNNYIREKKHQEQIKKTFQLPTEKGLR